MFCFWEKNSAINVFVILPVGCSERASVYFANSIFYFKTHSLHLSTIDRNLKKNTVKLGYNELGC